MNMPGFTAEAGLQRSRNRYCGQWVGAGGDVMAPAAPITGIIPILNICEIAPWLCVISPELNVSYQPPQPPEGQGFPGTLTIEGQNFASDVDVTLTICNCDLDPYRTIVHTSQDRYACLAVPPYTCFTIPGGSFTTTVPCFCGGGTGIACGGPPVINQATVMVTAQDANGNSASGSTGNPC
jgi:hypothetical protein